MSTQFNRGNTSGKGRPKGSPNKASAELKEKLSGLLELSIEKLSEQIDTMQPRDLIDLMHLCARYVLPKPVEKIDADENTVIRITGNLLK